MFDCSRDAPEELVVLYSQYSCAGFETLRKGLAETSEDKCENNYDFLFFFVINHSISRIYFETDCYILIKQCHDEI